jgi:hypothetical protein
MSCSGLHISPLVANMNSVATQHLEPVLGLTPAVPEDCGDPGAWGSMEALLCHGD